MLLSWSRRYSQWNSHVTRASDAGWDWVSTEEHVVGPITAATAWYRRLWRCVCGCVRGMTKKKNVLCGPPGRLERFGQMVRGSSTMARVWGCEIDTYLSLTISNVPFPPSCRPSALIFHSVFYNALLCYCMHANSCSCHTIFNLLYARLAPSVCFKKLCRSILSREFFYRKAHFHNRQPKMFCTPYYYWYV